jgi:hypothetical protein
MARQVKNQAGCWRVKKNNEDNIHNTVDGNRIDKHLARPQRCSGRIVPRYCSSACLILYCFILRYSVVFPIPRMRAAAS